MTTFPSAGTNKIRGIVITFLCVLLALVGLVTTQDLQQKNKETLFLTEDGQKDYLHFIENFHISPVAIGVHPENKKDNLDKICDESCTIFDLGELGVNGLNSKKESAYIILANEETSNEEFKEILKNITTILPTLKLTGVPYTNILLDQYSQAIKKTLFPALFAGLFLLLLIYFRSLSESLVVFFPGLLGAALSLGVTKILYGHSNLITSIIPLLIFVIELSLVLHIHETAKEFKNLIEALKDKKEPIILMVVTTFIGFGALYFSELKAISDFGVLAAGLILLATILTLVWLYAINDFLSNPWQSRWAQKEKKSSIESSKVLTNMAGFWPTKRILLFGVISLFLGLICLPRIPIITDASRYFPKSSGLKAEMDRISRDYMGTPIIEVLLPLKSEGGQELYNELIKLDQLEKMISQELNLKVMSTNQLVRFANQKYAKVSELPPNHLAYFGLRSQVPSALSLGYPVEDHYRLTLLGENTNVDLYEEKLAKLSSILIKAGFPLTGENAHHFNGLYFHLMKAQKKMITVLFKSFFSSLLLISFLSWIYFRSRRVFLLFMVVNILPVLASFPLLWLFGLSFNIATVMTYSISLGLIVDSSFHILHALRKEDITQDFYLKTVVTPILIGSSFLAICFFLFALNDFLPIRQFGICLALVILWGLLMDLKVLPTLFRGPRPLPQKLKD